MLLQQFERFIDDFAILIEYGEVFTHIPKVACYERLKL